MRKSKEASLTLVTLVRLEGSTRAEASGLLAGYAGAFGRGTPTFSWSNF
jgi:hypothetical protein